MEARSHTVNTYASVEFTSSEHCSLRQSRSQPHLHRLDSGGAAGDLWLVNLCGVRTVEPITVYCVQPYWTNGRKFVRGELRQFETESEAMKVGARLGV